MTKLTDLEERVLRYLIENGSCIKGIAIQFNDVELGFLIESVKNLEKMGLVKNCSSLDCAGAFLTDRGLSYFADLEKELYGTYYEDIKSIDASIKELSTLKDNDNDHIRFMEICEINNHVKDLRAGVSNYRDTDWTFTVFGETPPTFKSNVKVVSERLKRYKNSLIQKAQKEKFQKNNTRISNVFKPQNSVTVSNNIEITLTQTLTNVINLEDSELSAEDKITLQKMLTEIEFLKTQKKNKKKLSEKIKDLGKWIFEKGIPAIASCLPYIAQTISTLKG